MCSRANFYIIIITALLYISPTPYEAPTQRSECIYIYIGSFIPGGVSFFPMPFVQETEGKNAEPMQMFALKKQDYLCLYMWKTREPQAHDPITLNSVHRSQVPSVTARACFSTGAFTQKTEDRRIPAKGPDIYLVFFVAEVPLAATSAYVTLFAGFPLSCTAEDLAASAVSSISDSSASLLSSLATL